MDFSSINIQGNIISSEILDKIRSEEKFKHQSPESFGLSRNASLRDEIGLAWSIMRTHWQAYKKRLDTLPKGDTGTSLTREKLIIPLLSELGYEVGIQRAQQVNGKSYAISHSASNRDNYPIHIMGYNDDLDKRREKGQRISPHALVQEYLNNTEHMFAIVTNGRHLRLLRDATRLVRMSYLEFDLERMFEEELYADFSLLFRVFHATRMPDKIDLGPDSVIEYYHQESMASGTRIREKLSEAVEHSIKTLANGFLSHKENEELVSLFKNEELSTQDFYTYQLRLIYRILFLIVLEERKLVYPDNLDEEGQRYRKIYFKYYSIERLRKLTENRVYVDEDKYDLWESLKSTFLLFEKDFYGSKIGIKPLGSGLFSPTALGVLGNQYLNNGDLLEVLKSLTTFIGEQGELVRVNYSDLDVEEFGSVYEGLLEYDPKVEKVGGLFQFSFIEGEGRSSSGSHYTPEELVTPLIKHSLEYVIADKLNETNPEEALLSIKVCDVACGSGHILLSAARKIATELACIREGAEQPSPTFYRVAIRDVIRNCIYGVDLNPLAVELCKVAMWLEAHNPNEPLNFLDHHIKNGNAIVGLAHYEELERGIASEAFKTLPGDEKDVAIAFKKRNDLERKTTNQLSTYDTSSLDNSLSGLRASFREFENLPEKTPEQIEAKKDAYQKLTSGRSWFRLKSLADLQVAQFFIAKTSKNKASLTTDSQYRTYLNSGAQIYDRGLSMAKSQEKVFFHWFLEFPEVFSVGGFDCILGNPPFKGGQKLSGAYGHRFTQFIQFEYAPIGSVDLVTYFFRRIYDLIRTNGFQSLISTNTVAQGSAREGGLEIILKNGGTINHAVKSMPWPGIAAVEVSLVTVHKGEWRKNRKLNLKDVSFISSYLDDKTNLNPFQLKSNLNKCFQGSILLGKGFLLEPAKAHELIAKNGKYKEVILPYLNGQDLNNDPNQEASRFVINFNQWDESRAKKYKECYSIVKNKVKPERLKQKDKVGKEKWWQHLRPRLEQYDQIKSFKKVLVHTRVTKTHAFIFQNPNQVFSDATIVFMYENYCNFSVLQSSLHEWWSWHYSSTMKGDRRYSSTDAFETFPFPEKTNSLEEIGEHFYDLRRTISKRTGLGFTKVFEQIHNASLPPKIENINRKEIVSEFGLATWNLVNQLKDLEDFHKIYADTVNLIINLRKLIIKLDYAVTSAYGWQDIELDHSFHEIEYLPENDRIRFTISDNAIKEVLKRLLLLNHERFEAEVKRGLHKKKDVVAYYQQKGEELPEGVVFSDSKSTKTPKKKKPTRKSQPTIEGQSKLFEEPNLFNSPFMVSESCKVSIQKEDGNIIKYDITQNAKKDAFTGDYKQIKSSSKLAEVMLGRKVDDIFVFGGAKYKILEVM